MAINLWEAGGLETSYNPITEGKARALVVDTGEYILTFKAKSDKGSKLNVYKAFEWDNYRYLTSEFIEYTFELNVRTTGKIEILDISKTNDIIVKDIVLVEKPLGGLTINGVDGFDSFNGRLAPTATVIDNQTVRLDAVSWGESSYIKVDVEPNTTYYVSADSDCEYGIFNYDASRVLLEYSLKGGKFNSENNTVIRLYFKNVAKEKGTFFFRNPMITLGAFKVPYEKKKGSIMVKPSIVKNIIREPIENWRYNWLGNSTIDKFEGYVRVTLDTSKQSSSATSHRYELIEVSSEKEYTLSFTARANRGGVQPNYVYIMSETAGNKVVSRDTVPTLSTEWKRYSIPLKPDKTVSDANIMIGMYSGTSSNVNGDWVELKDVQLEEGSVATPYTPFKTQLNKVPNYAPSKNLLIQQDLTTWANDRSIVEDTGEYYKGNKVYKVSFKNENLPRIYTHFDKPAGNVSASVYIKMIKKDGGIPSLYIREENFGTTYKTTAINSPVGEWTKIKIDNIEVPKRAMFLLYYSPQELADIEMLVAMPQVEIGETATEFEHPYKKHLKTANLVPKKNLLKPFGDSGYYFRDGGSNYTLINPSRLELNAKADHEYFRVEFPVKPYTNYTVSANHNAMIGIYTADGASGIVQYDRLQKATFNSGKNTVLRFYFSNIGLGAGNYYIENVQIEEGSILTPFEAYKESNRKAFLIPKKNLFNFKASTPIAVGGYINLTKTDDYVEMDIKAGGYGFKFLNVPVERNTDYVYSVKNDILKGSTLGIRVHFLNTDVYSVAVRGSTEHVFNSGENDSIDLMYYAGMAVDVDSLIRVYDIQLEKGKKATPYEPYKLTNKQAKR